VPLPSRQTQISNNSYLPLVIHVVYRFGVGGLENGLVNLINHMSPTLYRHAIVCLTRSTAFKSRINRQGVRIVELHKAPGQDLRAHHRFWQFLRQLRPDIVHTRNLATLEFQLTSALARVPGRVHGEHGRDIYDLDGTSIKYNVLRRAVRPFVRQYTAVSADLTQWLIDTIGVRSNRVNQIYNGVDIVKFSPRKSTNERALPKGFAPHDAFIVGTVGRMEPVKDPITLIQAFLRLVQSDAAAHRRMRLIVVGDGSLYRQANDMLRNSYAENLAWLPGEREDVPEMMRAMDLFVLPSLREGISNTILEAMATGLPVVATNTGGNPELVNPKKTGELIPHSNPVAMADAIASYFSDPCKVSDHGRNARQNVECQFSMQAMINGYISTYDNVLRKTRGTSHVGCISSSTRPL
jgi:sugar transferase (PEP-CTERM/EpsH1 system associated)